MGRSTMIQISRGFVKNTIFKDIFPFKKTPQQNGAAEIMNECKMTQLLAQEFELE